MGCTEKKMRHKKDQGITYAGRKAQNRDASLSHSPRLRKVMPFVTGESALAREAVKVLLCPVEKEVINRKPEKAC